MHRSTLIGCGMIIFILETDLNIKQRSGDRMHLQNIAMSGSAGLKVTGINIEITCAQQTRPEREVADMRAVDRRSLL